MNYYTDRVAKGAAELDRILPGWERKIDLDVLDLRHECDCVLGQLAVELQAPKDPERTLYDLALDQIWSGCDPDWAVDRGFNLPGDSDWPREFVDLTQAWKQLITQRLEAGE